MSSFVVDTHALVWFFSRDSRLSDKARAILLDPESQLIIPAIVLAEIKHLIRTGRFANTFDNILFMLTSDPRCLIYSIDLAVVQQAPSDLDIHDSLIVGTFLALPSKADGVLTRDEEIKNSNLVPTVW